MKNIYLISGVGSTKLFPTAAAQLYTSSLFVKSLDYAQTQNADGIHILSAKYGLLDLDAVVAPYKDVVSEFSRAKQRQWAAWVRTSLSERYSLEDDRFILLAGAKYHMFLTPYMPHLSIPLEHLSKGHQLQWLTEMNEIHSSLPVLQK